ncbi:MAG TPA: 7-carboxy-7-deazaguanine synthase [Sphingobium sp.]|nr:7-carboxy-7-deazaguanine synthase [Sphingobium sp.]
MSYAVKEMFLTLQGEGVHSGRRAVFLRFAGCNLWTGREEDRRKAVCQFCDTDFVGTDGDGGGKFADAESLADAALAFWGEGGEGRYIVITGGEPMLQIDDALVDALHARGFAIAIESNGTIAAHPGIDWVCISPKAGSDVVQRSGNELKLVWPQPGAGHSLADVEAMEGWAFDHHLIQPLDDPNAAANMQAAVDLVMTRPNWRLSLQSHKYLGLR